MRHLLQSRRALFVEIGIVIGCAVTAMLLNWRLFAFGAESQLFLYGDNLTSLNNLYYVFSHFSLSEFFGTFIGQSGMMGSYPLSEPQNSMYYFPITVLLVLFKVFRFNAVGLYYELLFLHLFHFVLGTFFIYKLAGRYLRLRRPYAVLAAVVYAGLGWNVSWIGTSTLSYMIGLFPLSLFAFFRYLDTKKLREYCLFVLSLSLVLFAGGIVNFFFYILLNFLVLYVGFAILKAEPFRSAASSREQVRRFLLIFILAPILGLFSYSLQLYQTFRVSADVFHSSSAYDYLAFFGTHFYDLVGLIVPKFALVNFGSVTNPTMVLEYSLANILYVGILPLLILFIGIFCLRDRMLGLFVFIFFLNLVLSFGGAFFLYDATYFFPGNDLFRGHYKYLVLAGAYLALLVPYVLSYFNEIRSNASYDRIIRGVARALWGVLFFALAFSFLAFSLKFLQKTNPSLLDYYTLALTISSYGYRILLMGVLSLMSVRFFVGNGRTLALCVLGIVLLLDTSINFKYKELSRTDIHALTADTFFSPTKGKTVVNDIDKYSQLYFIPEILGVDPVFQYSAIPNRYLEAYNARMVRRDGYSVKMFQAAGIDGVLTTKRIDDPQFALVSEKKVNGENYKDLYLYNADGDIHNDWGENGGYSGNVIRYYGVQHPMKAYFSKTYRQKVSIDAALDYAAGSDFDPLSPALVTGKQRSPDKSVEPRAEEVTFLEDRPNSKRIQLDNEQSDGVVFINIPYSTIWKAKVDGERVPIYNANGAFLGVQVQRPNAVVEIYVDDNMSWLLLGLSVLVSGIVVIGIFLPERMLPSKLKRSFGLE